MSTQIFTVDFATKKVLSKHIGPNKVEYYRCNSCLQKYSSTKADPSFVEYVAWEHTVNKRLVQYYLCKHCISTMHSIIKE